MGKSRKTIKLFNSFTEDQVKKIIKMAWDDRTTYKEIEKLYKLGPNEVEKFMQHHLSDKDFIRWKKRLSKRFNFKGKRSKEIGARG